MIWDLVLRLSGQVRLITGPDRVLATGWDMTAALALGAALGVPARLTAEMLPAIEVAMTTAMNSDTPLDTQGDHDE